MIQTVQTKNGNHTIQHTLKMDLYTHVPTSIALSATLVSEEPFIAEMHKLAYPLGDRYKDTPLTRGYM